MPCDEFEGFQKDICLRGIYGKLQNIQTGGGLGAIVGEGTLMASYLLSHYLGGTGQDLWVIPSDFTFKEVFTQANTLALEALKTSPGVNALTTIICGCCGVTGYNINLSEAASFSESGVTETGGLYYAYGGGGVTVRSSLPTTIVGSFTTPNSFRIRTSTPVEIYDKYDWCFGSDSCEASDYHFADLGDAFKTTVGEFFALEQAGWAAQFNWYSGWNVVYELEVSCESGTPVFNVISITRENLPNINQDTGIIPRPFKSLTDSGYSWQVPPAPNETLDCDDTITPGVCQ